jgi:hypothetical protein
MRINNSTTRTPDTRQKATARITLRTVEDRKRINVKLVHQEI